MPASIRLVLATLVAPLALTGCTSQADQAAEALCSDFAWDPGQTDEANTDQMAEIIGDYEYANGVDDVYNRARRQCPEALVEYDAYAEEMSRKYEAAMGDPETAAPAPEADTSIQDALTARGVTDSMVRRLGAMADLTGYGYGPGTTLPFEQAQSFAAVLLVTCDQVAAGALTWDQAIRDDMATGAPEGAARKMNGYLRDVYCPALS